MTANSNIYNFIRIKKVSEKTSISRSQIYRLQAEGKFPKRLRLSPRVAVYRESEIDAWLDERVAVARKPSP